MTGGFNRNPVSRKGGFLNQTANDDPRRSTYSRQEVEEAKDGLRLLKAKMQQRSGVSANRDQRPPMYNPSSNSGVNDKRRAYTGVSSGLPPMMPPPHSDNLNNSVLSTGANGPSGSSPQNQNYRKSFKPNLGGQGQS
jgi:hypothetical protein